MTMHRKGSDPTQDVDANGITMQDVTQDADTAEQRERAGSFQIRFSMDDSRKEGANRKYVTSHHGESGVSVEQLLSCDKYDPFSGLRNRSGGDIAKMVVKEAVPAVGWLSTYKWRETLKADVIAGVTVGIMLVPQGMAYALVAGLPALYGLYTSVMPLYIYALFGTSRQLAVGPVAIVSMLVEAGLRSLDLDPVEDEAKYVRCAITLALLVGIFQTGLGLFRLGFLVNFLSHPVISGFTSAAAITIGFTQLGHLMGYKIEKSNYMSETLKSAVNNVHKFHWETFLLGSVLVVILLTIKHLGKLPSGKYKWMRPLGPLTVVAVTTPLMAITRWNEKSSLGIKVVGKIDGKFPPINSVFEWDMLGDLASIAVFIAFVGFMESIAIAKSLAARNKYELDSNKELIGLGLANVVGALFSSYPCTGSFSRSAVNDDTGAKTGLSSIVTATVVVFTLLVLSEALYFLPMCALAAIVISAVSGLVDFEEWKFLWATDKKDWMLWNLAFLGTLFFGIELGIGIAVCLSLAFVIYETATPHTAQLGQVLGMPVYRNVKQYPEAQVEDGIIIIRVDAPIYFANVAYVKDKLRQFESLRLKEDGDEPQTPLRFVILEMSPISSIDSTGIHALIDIIKEYQSRGISLCMANPNRSVMGILEKASIPSLLGREKLFLRVHDAVKWCRKNIGHPEESEEGPAAVHVDMRHVS